MLINKPYEARLRKNSPADFISPGFVFEKRERSGMLLGDANDKNRFQHRIRAYLYKRGYQRGTSTERCCFAYGKNKERESYIQTVLIDDYNEPKQILDVGKFIEWLGERDALPDFAVMESDLVPLAPLLLERLPMEHRKKYEAHFEKIGRINCSFLVAVWQLCRLGALPAPKLNMLTDAQKPFICPKTLTILPRSYETNEHKALDIIKSSSFAECVARIEYIFF